VLTPIWTILVYPFEFSLLLYYITCILADLKIYYDSYNRAKQRYLQGKDDQLRPVHHLVSAAEAGALVRTVTFVLSRKMLISLDYI
jgi:hypothetical protein